MIRFTAVTVAVLVAVGLAAELAALGLRAAGMDEQAANLASLLVVVFAAYSRLREFPPDEQSLAWARSAPTAAGAIVGAAIAVLLVAWFFLTEDDPAEAAGASVLAVTLALVCAFISRRGYARRVAG